MVAYTMVHVSSEQGKSVIQPHYIEFPVKIYTNFYCKMLGRGEGGAEDIPIYI